MDSDSKNRPPRLSTKQRGDAAEDAALEHLQRAGLALVRRNFRTPGRGGGEVDLIMRERDGTLVFVEVRLRSSRSHGGGAASVTATKQRRIVFAARHFLLRLAAVPPCRFDVVAVSPTLANEADAHRSLLSIDWIRGAFTADGHA